MLQKCKMHVLRLKQGKQDPEQDELNGSFIRGRAATKAIIKATEPPSVPLPMCQDFTAASKPAAALCGHPAT